MQIGGIIADVIQSCAIIFLAVALMKVSNAIQRQADSVREIREEQIKDKFDKWYKS